MYEKLEVFLHMTDFQLHDFFLLSGFLPDLRILLAGILPYSFIYWRGVEKRRGPGTEGRGQR